MRKPSKIFLALCALGIAAGVLFFSQENIERSADFMKTSWKAARGCEKQAFTAWEKSMRDTQGRDEAVLQRGVVLWKRCPEFEPMFRDDLGMLPEQAVLALRERKLREEEIKQKQQQAVQDTVDALQRLSLRLRAEIASGLYVESEIWQFLYASSVPRPHLPTIQGPTFTLLWEQKLQGSVVMKQGLLLRLKLTRAADSAWEDWIWTFDQIYRRSSDATWTNFAQGQANPYSPSPDVVQGYEDAVLRWKPSLARDFNNRAHRFYQRKEYARAREVIQYALWLDPKYALAWYNAAAYAARNQDVNRTIAYLRNATFSGQKLVMKIRQDPDFRELLEKNQQFRSFLSQQAGTQEASALLKSFSFEFDYARSVACGEEDTCESVKEWHVDFVLTRLQEPGWRLVLKKDIQDLVDIELGVPVRMADIGNRIFVAVASEAFEVQLHPPMAYSLGPADSVHDSFDSQFPLFLVRSVGKQPSDTWEIRLYDGNAEHKSISQGCFSTLAALQDVLWTLEKKGGNFHARDLATGKSFPLQSMRLCP